MCVTTLLGGELYQQNRFHVLKNDGIHSPLDLFLIPHKYSTNRVKCFPCSAEQIHTIAFTGTHMKDDRKLAHRRMILTIYEIPRLGWASFFLKSFLWVTLWILLTCLDRHQRA